MIANAQNVRVSVKLSTQIDRTTDKESMRFALANVHVMPNGDDSVYLSATNGRTAAFVKAEGHADACYLMPHEVAKRGRIKKSPTVSLNGRWESDKGKFSDEQPAGRMPNFADVLPNVLEDEKNVSVTVNPKLLADLLDSIVEIGGESETVTLTIPTDDDSKPVIARNGENLGLIMPMQPQDPSSSRNGSVRVAENTRRETGRVRALVQEYRAAFEAQDTPQRIELNPSTGLASNNQNP